MKRFIVTIVILLGAAASIAGQRPLPAAAAATALADEVFAAVMERYPEIATFLGAPRARHDRAFDNTPEARRAWDSRVDLLFARFGRIDRASLAGRPEQVTLGFVQQALDSEIRRRACRAELWGVDHMNGWQFLVPQFLTRQPVTTPADRRAALDRLSQYPRYIDREIALLRSGLAAGYSAPQVSVDRVLQQIDGLLNIADAVASPFAAPAQASEDAAFRRQVAQIVDTGITPAIRRYRTFLGEYKNVARSTVGIAAIPNGAACYEALILDNTSLDLKADDIHQLGLTMMAQIQEEMRPIGTRAFGSSDVDAILTRLRTDPGLRFRSADEIMASSRTALERARAALPKYFGRLPMNDFIIEPFADHEAPTMPPAMYWPGPLDGSKPGIYKVNLYKPQDTPRYGNEGIAFHEAVPGHHLQIALAIEVPMAHPIAQVISSTAFVEGWGLYSERLADEMGLYSGDVDRLGMLSNAAWRAARLVVDTGLHSKGWTRQQAVEYMRANTAVGENDIQTEVDRYIIMPGQALAYMIGYRELVAQRDKAEAALAARFDIRRFHDAALGRGGVTLPMLREQIDDWIQQQTASLRR